jgi:hypothetical protein
MAIMMSTSPLSTRACRTLASPPPALEAWEDMTKPARPRALK